MRELRTDLGIAQAELARRVGTSPAHLNKLEAGLKAPTVVTVEALARALGVAVGELFPVGPAAATSNPADPLWTKITGDLRRRDHEFLLLVRESIRLLDRAQAGRSAGRK